MSQQAAESKESGTGIAIGSSINTPESGPGRGAKRQRVVPNTSKAGWRYYVESTSDTGSLNDPYIYIYIYMLQDMYT